jgi:Rrf2 family transcriptional regulator, cysteine metabolism repressor
MRVSNRLDYAVRALIELALRDGAGPIAAREIARNRQIPEAFIHQVMASLARAGMIRSMRGPSGGHVLAISPERISIADIAAAVDAEPVLLSSADPLGRFWNGLYEVQGTYLRNMTLAGLAAQHRDRQTVNSYSI